MASRPSGSFFVHEHAFFTPEKDNNFKAGPISTGGDRSPRNSPLTAFFSFDGTTLKRWGWRYLPSH